MAGLARRHQRWVAALGGGATMILASLTLGVHGGIASAMFAPVLIWLSFQSANPPVVERGGRADLVTALDAALAAARGNGPSDGPQKGETVALVARIDGYDVLEELHDRSMTEAIVARTRQVFGGRLDDQGQSKQLDPSSFGAVLRSEEDFDLEALLNTCTRIQHDLSEPLICEGVPLRWTVSIGFAGSSRFGDVDGDGLLQAAYTALNEARRKGPNAVRGYSTAMDSRRARQKLLGREAALAFDRGEVFAYFQPQISMQDGRLTGFEALTRWKHPVRGLVSPADFLPVLEQAGLMHRLGDTMITQALQALQYWDANGLDVPRVGVNFSTEELRDPLLVDRVAMLVDAHDMSAGRLVVEVLETVIAKASDDVIVRNLSDLSALGCGIDLDDFGTGYASITNIRRFSVGRIKIDRSFVTGVDRDPEQRDMVAAILTMAERLGVRTLAEGIETKGEHAALRALGCDDAQGFEIARPMPLEETVEWARKHFADGMRPVQIQKRTG